MTTQANSPQSGADKRATVAKGENTKGILFALTRVGSEFEVWKRCANYASHVRGGISYSWRYVQRGMTEDAARALFAKRLKGAR